jgi:ribosomal protein L20
MKGLLFYCQILVGFSSYNISVKRKLLSAMAAGGLVTFVATKVTKKAFSRKASLPHLAFALQIRQNHRL